MSKGIRVAASAFLLSLFVASPAISRSGSAPGMPGAGADISWIRIDNFGRVDATYYRGAAPESADYGALATLGIKTLVDLRSDDLDPREKDLAARARLNYVQIPMTTREPPTEAMLDRFLRLVNDPVNQPVYVHCVGGRHRTGVMTAVYRMTHHGWSADQAFKEMKAYKFGPDFLHPEFKAFIYAYKAARASKAAEPVQASAR